MRWEISDEQQAFQETISAWLARVAPVAAVKGWFEAGDTSSFDELLYSEGWIEVGVAEELGGQGGGLLELALMAEEMGRAAVPSGDWLAAVLASPAIEGLAVGMPSWQRAENRLALAIGAGGPPDAFRPAVVADDGTLTGEIPLVLGAEGASALIVPATSSTGRALYLVDASARGVDCRARRLLDRSRPVADLGLHDVAARPLLLDVDSFLRDAARRAAVLVAADCLGATERMLELAVEYSKQRQQFGVPIGSFQAMKHAAASMLVAVESARSIVYYAAASVVEKNVDCALHASIAKAQVTATGSQLADSALTMHGAIGYTWEHDLHRYYKRARFDEVLFGPPSVWNERIALELLGRPRAS